MFKWHMIIFLWSECKFLCFLFFFSTALEKLASLGNKAKFTETDNYFQWWSYYRHQVIPTMHIFAKKRTQTLRNTRTQSFQGTSLCQGCIHNSRTHSGSDVALWGSYCSRRCWNRRSGRPRFCWLCWRKFASTFTSRATLTKPLRADKATSTHSCQGLFTIYEEGQLFLWCK